MATSTELHQIYLAYFGRPPDADGLAYYANVPLGNVIAAFSASPESVSLYGAMFGAPQVNAIYRNLFNRDAAPAEAQHWINEITQPGGAGPAAAAMEILKGAQNDDRAAVTNKLAVAASYTAALVSETEMNAYSGAAAADAARNFLKTVDATPASVAVAQAAVPAQVAAQVAAPPPVNPGTPTTPGIALTLGADDLEGTAGDDLFVADPALVNGAWRDTLEDADSVRGGAGHDTLRASLRSGNLVYPALRDVEHLVLRSLQADSAISLAFAPGVKEITVADSTEVAVVYDAGDVRLAVRNQLTDVAFGGLTAAVQALELTSVGSLAAAATVSLSATGPSAATTLDIAMAHSHVHLTDMGGAAGTVNISATGTNRLVLVDAAATAVTLAVRGSGSVDLRGADYTALTQLQVDAAGGGVQIDLTRRVESLTGSRGDDRVTFIDGVTAAARIDLGDGNDTLALKAAPAAGAVLAGGAGNDTLSLSQSAWSALSAFGAGDRAKITGFETLALNEAVSGTYDVSPFTGTTGFSALAGIAGNATVTGLASGSQITLAGLLDNSPTLTVQLAGGAAGTADALAVRLAPADDRSSVFFRTAGVEALTLEVVKASAMSLSNPFFLDDPALQSLTVTGDNFATVFGLAPITGLARIDASASRAGAYLALEGNAATTVLGSAYADRLFVFAGATVTGNGGIDPLGWLQGDAYEIRPGAAGRLPGTITDLHRGDRLLFTDHGRSSFDATRLTLSANAGLQDYLDAAAAGDGGTNGILRWFQFGGDTYAMQDRSAAASYTYGTDAAVRLVGLVDLGQSVLPNAVEARLVI